MSNGTEPSYQAPASQIFCVKSQTVFDVQNHNNANILNPVHHNMSRHLQATLPPILTPTYMPPLLNFYRDESTRSPIQQSLIPVPAAQHQYRYSTMDPIAHPTVTSDTLNKQINTYKVKQETENGPHARHYQQQQQKQPHPVHNQNKPQNQIADVQFSLMDFINSLALVRDQPNLAPTLCQKIRDISDGKRGRHELQYFIGCMQNTSNYHEADTMEYKEIDGIAQDAEDDSDLDLVEQGGSSNTGIRGITWQESRQSYQASVCISLKQIYKIFSTKRVGKEQAIRSAIDWLKKMRRCRANGENLDSLMRAGLFTKKVSNTGIRGITWQESRMKFQCSIYMEKGNRVQKYFPTGLNRSGPRYEEAFRAAKQWMRKMEARKKSLISQKQSILSVPDSAIVSNSQAEQIQLETVPDERTIGHGTGPLTLASPLLLHSLQSRPPDNQITLSYQHNILLDPNMLIKSDTHHQ